MKITDMPLEDRPREKAKLHGTSELTDSELLSLIIGSGIKGLNAIEVSQNLLTYFNGLSNLSSTSFESLESKGLSDAKILRLISTFEIAKRLSRPMLYNNKSYILNQNLRSLCLLKYLDKEVVYIYIFGKNNKLIIEKKLYEGTESSVLISPDEILKEVIRYKGNSFILLHNHPKGLAEPSKADNSSTKKIRTLSKIMKVEFVDHIILGKNSFYSFNQKKRDDPSLISIFSQIT